MGEISYLAVYLILILDKFVHFFLVGFIFSALICFISALTVFIGTATGDLNEKLERWFSRLRNWTCVTAIICGILYTIIPCTKQACVIYAVPTLVNSKTVQEHIPNAMSKLFKIADLYLTEIIDEKEGTVKKTVKEKSED